MKTIELTLPRPHAGQERILKEARRFNVYNCGRRFGKTTLGLTSLIDDPRGKGALNGYPTAWMAPNYKYLQEVWREAERILRPITARLVKSENRIELITGGSIDFWSVHNNPDAGRSRKYGKVFIDEAAIIPSNTLEQLWNEGVRPTLSDYEGGADFASTPKGSGFFKDMYERGQDPNRPEWMSWQLPTSLNPYIPPAEIEAARRELPTLAFKQEYLAEFVESFGAIFKPPAYYEPSELPRDGYREATGCDFAYSRKSGDWTVFLQGRAKDDVIYITDLYRAQAESTVWANELKQYPNPLLFAGGQEKGIVAFLRRDYGIRLKMKRAVTDKVARARPAAAAWNRGEIRLPAGAPITTEIEAELLSFTGDPRYDAHDDIVDATSALHDALIAGRTEWIAPGGLDGH